jgi:hypothetical protein
MKPLKGLQKSSGGGDFISLPVAVGRQRGF